MSDKPFYDLINYEMIQLCSSDSRRFNVHKAVLESRCKVIYSALSKGFSESNEGVYTCIDTTYDTLGRVVEWMYTEKYTLVINKEIDIVTEQPPGIEQGAKPNNLSELAEEMESGPIMAHLQLYIFCDLYLITELKWLAFQQLKGALMNAEKAGSAKMQRAVIAALDLAFSKIKPGDELLEWLAHFASSPMTVRNTQQPRKESLLF